MASHNDVQITALPSAPGLHHKLSTITLSNEQYERLFLQSRPPPKQQLSHQFADPAVLGLIGFVMATSPTACFLMSLDHTNGTSAVALSGVYFLLGGLGLFTAGVLEWVIGNTFDFVVFCTFGGFWMSFGFLNDPANQITQAFQGGADAINFNTGLAIYWIFWVVLVTVYWVGSLRTNLAFVEIFTSLWFHFVFLGAGYNMLGHGDKFFAISLLRVAGGFGLAAAIGGWYIATGLVMEAVKMPFTIPFGDLSSRILIRRVRTKESDLEMD